MNALAVGKTHNQAQVGLSDKCCAIVHLILKSELLKALFNKKIIPKLYCEVLIKKVFETDSCDLFKPLKYYQRVHHKFI